MKRIWKKDGIGERRFLLGSKPTKRGRLKRRARECWVWWWEAGDAPMSVCRGERPKRNPYDNRGRWILMREVSRRTRKGNRAK